MPRYGILLADSTIATSKRAQFLEKPNKKPLNKQTDTHPYQLLLQPFKCNVHIMLRDELTLKWMKEKMVWDTPEHVDSEKLNR
jgi:hypothetical protein